MCRANITSLQSNTDSLDVVYNPLTRYTTRRSARRPRPMEQKPSTKVRFADDVAVVVGHTINLDSMTDDEIYNCWWTNEEKVWIVKKAKAVVVKAHKTMPEATQLVQDTYRGVEAVVESDNDDDKGVQEMISEPTLYAERLVSWVERCQPARGLEQILVRSKSKDLRREIVARMNAASINGCCINSDTDKVASYYGKQARVSRVMSRLYGYADATAAGIQ